ncbi:hypothetical protein BD413DRAFT_614828 [Trametes elegans]|nr:hypothetical protein BD413DRAFT_614828 [Trametes elegans]
MLFCDGSQITLTLDPADGRYALAFSHKYPTYTTASIRDTPFPPQSRALAGFTSTTSPRSAMEGRSHLRYPIPDMHEVQPGVLSTGQWTVNHPFVDAYLTALARLAPKHKPQQGPRASAPPTATTSPVMASQALPDAHPAPTFHAALPSTRQSEAEKLRWRAQHGGIAAATTVAQVITVQYQLFPEPGSTWYAAQVPRLSGEKKQVVFALAALKVLNHPTHPAHWALWAKNVLQRTAQVVEDILELKPCPIVSHVAWLGVPESVWALHGLQSAFIPPPPPQSEKPKGGGMTLRKRKAPVTSSSSTPAEAGVALRVSPRKRQRTTRAQAALAQAQARDASVAAAPPPSHTNSTLLDVPLPSSDIHGAGDISKDVKREMLDVAGASPALQPLGLPLAIPDSAAATASSTSDIPCSEPAPAATPSSSTASLPPGATRRSTRPRRKPAQGPVTLSAPSPSTPASTLSTPSTSPAPNEKPSQSQRARAESCGSSTAVSEAGEASEGTVVDAEAELAAASRADLGQKGKRKAAEIDEPEPGANFTVVVRVEQEAIPAGATPENAAVAPNPKGGRRSRAEAKAKAKAKPPPRKRARLSDADPLEPASVVALAIGGADEPLSLTVTAGLTVAPSKRAAKKPAARKA